MEASASRLAGSAKAHQSSNPDMTIAIQARAHIGAVLQFVAPQLPLKSALPRAAAFIGSTPAAPALSGTGKPAPFSLTRSTPWKPLAPASLSASSLGTSRTMRTRWNSMLRGWLVSIRKAIGRKWLASVGWQAGLAISLIAGRRKP